VEGTPASMTATRIKDTISLCPTCLDEIPARVVEVGGEVWMEKACPEHGPFRGLVERDPELYRLLMHRSSDVLLPGLPRTTLAVPIVHRCNLACDGCYLPDRSRPDMTLDRWRQILDEHVLHNVLFTGGEPLLHPALPELVRLARAAGKYAMLSSNGLLFARDGVAERMAEAGVQLVIFGYSNSTTERERAQRSRALENLARVGILADLGITVRRGETEGIVAEAIDLALAHGLRVRVRNFAHPDARGGLTPRDDLLCLSELLALTAAALGVDARFFRETFRPDDNHHNAGMFSLRVLLDRETRAIRFWDSGPYTRRTHDRFAERRAAYPDDPSIRVVIWQWSNRFNIDLNECRRTGVSQITYDGRVRSFQEAIQESDAL